MFGTKRHCIIATPSHQQALRASGTTYCNGKRKTDDNRKKRYSHQSKRDQAEWARHRLGDCALNSDTKMMRPTATNTVQRAMTAKTTLLRY